jgi:LysR family transcriptional regulator, nitrogen assimilation regulatory protein
MDFRHLRSFVRIVDLGSLSRAAVSLHVAQPALSQQIVKLETQVKGRLLNRSSKGVTVTPAGQELYRFAVAILRQVDDAKSAIQDTAATPAGRVSLAFPLSLTATLALPLLQAVRERYPKIELQIFEELSGTIADQVLVGRLHAGLVFDDGQLQGLACQPVLQERLFLAVSPRSPWAKRKSMGLKELAKLPIVIPSPPHGVRLLMDAALEKIDLRLAHIVAEVSSLTLMKQAAAGGLGVTVLSWPSMALELTQGKLVAIEITRPTLTRTAVVCVSPSIPRTRATECVLDTLVRVIDHTARAAEWRGVKPLASAWAATRR